MKMVNGKLYKIISLILIFILLCCSCSLNNGLKKYLEEKYNDTFTELGNKNHSDYTVSWFESNTYPGLYIEVEKDTNTKKYFDDYNMKFIEYQFSQELSNTIKEYVSDCFIDTTDSTIVHSNTNYVDIEDIIKENDISIISIHSEIFIEEDQATKKNIYKAAQKIRNEYPNIRGTFKFIVVKNNTIKNIKELLRKYQILNDSDYYKDILYESKSISFSQTLKLPKFIVFDDYSFPIEDNFWE